MTRRKRSDSATAAVLASQAAYQEVKPPVHVFMPSEAIPFWDDIIKTRALDSWTPNDLITAATLAKTYLEIQHYEALVHAERRVTDGEDGPAKPTALHKVLNDLVSQSQALARTLQVHARATQGESRDQVKRNKLYSESRNAIESHDLDGLIARPH